MRSVDCQEAIERCVKIYAAANTTYDKPTVQVSGLECCYNLSGMLKWFHQQAGVWSDGGTILEWKPER